MKKLTLKVAFLLTAAETTFLATLPANEPQSKLSTTELRALSNIYYRVFGSHPKFDELIKVAMQKKWPGGERKKTHEAQRDILRLLMDLRTHAQNIEDLPLETLLGTIQLADPLQIAVAGAVMHVVDVPDLAKAVVMMSVNGVSVTADFGTKLTYEQIVKMTTLALPPAVPAPKVTFSFAGGPDNSISGVLLEGEEITCDHPWNITVTATPSVPA